MNKIGWQNTNGLESKSYICSFCGNPLASTVGWKGTVGDLQAFILICHHCTRPTFMDFDGEQIPNVKFGGDVQDISDSLVLQIYDEARKVMSVGGHTAAVLCCRKLLMHIAVDKGADKGKNFVYYVEYLSGKNYVPPDAKDWVDLIRKSGNEATHEIVIKGREDAEDIISFVEMILKLVYEFPAKVKRKSTPITS